ncbi:choice-of-anchor B family protein [Pleionea sediminis]|uniref:choice-of-anchor B family protein n=1 Tax=Pleionea sediminis TaxID=2569479 RepID=UPI00118602F3|nr:choice-of-anchor B family protein [Pleionea sediminis]
MTNVRYFKALALTAAVISSTAVLSHSEPTKPRFVSEQGKDTGDCSSPVRPCQSIGYAIKQANKGDQVLVSSGTYEVKSTEEVFFLKSQAVPVSAGYNRFDHFQVQSPELNKVYLKGVPSEFAADLRKLGFNVINDGKSRLDRKKLDNLLKSYEAIGKFQAEVPCENGQAGSFACNNIDLVAHVPLSSFSSNPADGNDIWGHVDLNTGNEYAIMGVRNGATVFDISTPESPVEVGTISGASSLWRDIKVYQHYDSESDSWKAYAYVTNESSGGVAIIDLNDLPNSISLVTNDSNVDTGHNVYISNVDHALNIKLDGTNPNLQLLGANRFSGSFHSYSLGNPEALNVEANQSSFNGYTHDGASVTITDARKDSDCFNGTEFCSIFVDFNEKEMLLWDITNPADTRELSNVTYNDVSNSAKYVHSGWVTEDKNFVLLHDEFDEQRAGLNSTVRIFDITDLRSPTQVGQWTGPTRAIDHNGFVRGNRYYMSNYTRGLTILDITDPANPVEVGFFDTYSPSNNDSFFGAWGTYPYLPSGLILVSDIDGGLYILRDNTKTQVSGSASFAQSNLTLGGGTSSIVVERAGMSFGGAAATVEYEVISGKAQQGNDFTLASGTLSWAANDDSDKLISLSTIGAVPADSTNNTFYVRLFNPTGGMTIGDNGYLTVNLSGPSQTGFLQFDKSSYDISESVTALELTVHRVGGSSGAASIDYSTVADSATAGEDFQATSGTLNWADGELDSKTVQITLIDDSIDESTESFSINLSSASGASLGDKSSVLVSLGDDDSNSAPTLTLNATQQASVGETVNLDSTASDADGDAISFQWEQLSGTSVALSSATAEDISFTAPDTAGQLTFELTVTDIKGASTSAQVVVTVVAEDSGNDGDDSDSGGSMTLLTLLLVSLAAFRRRYF